MRGLVVLVLVAVVGGLAGYNRDARAEVSGGTVTVKPGLQSPTAGIQEAVDSLGAGGGVVQIAAGEYPLRQAIRIRSGITLSGAGEATVLRKNKQFGSKLTAVTEGKRARVEDASGFREGDEVGFFDRTSVGWLHGQAVVRGVEGNELELSKNPGAKFDPAHGGAVINYFPAISGREISNVVIKDLMIDGRPEENPGPGEVSARAAGKPPELSFLFAAVDLIRVSDSRVENVRVRGWHADGISLQGKGGGNVVTKCYVENCRAHGMHAGGGLADSEFFENEARGNFGDGFYFCAKVTEVTVRENKFVANKASGVGGLGDSGDTKNVVTGNLCERNGTNGISLWEGEGNRVIDNVCKNNSQREPGRFNGIALAKTENSVVAGNRCFDDQPMKTQKHGIFELNNCQGNSFTSNDCRGNAQAGLVVPGKDSRESENVK